MAKKQTPFGPTDGDRTNIAVQRDTVNSEAAKTAQEKAAAANRQQGVPNVNSEPVGSPFGSGMHGMFE